MKTYSLCLSLLMLSPTLQAQTQSVVGHISFAKGSSAAQHTGQDSRLLGVGAEVYAGDNIQTAERSFVIIEFVDGAKITVRPNSSFSIDEYSNQASQKNARMVLHQGGVQASTGAIAQQQADKFQIKAQQNTVTAQQAEYSVQICDAQCAQQQAKKEAQAALIVARIVDVKGVVSAKTASASAKERVLALGDALYSSDTISSQNDSYALLVFPDGEKITLQANSQLVIQDYAYHVEGKKDNALFSLVKGSMRALTGAIGKENNGSYSINTPVATIGIRGTGFDLNCVGDCIADTNAPKDFTTIQLGQVDGLYSHVWQGQIVLHNQQGDTLLSTPNSNYIAAPDSVPQSLPALPEILLHTIAPRPDNHKGDIKQLFTSKTTHPASAAGVYFAVHKGHATLAAHGLTGNAQHSTTLNEHQQAYVGEQGDKPSPLSEPADFQLHDHDFDDQKDAPSESPFENNHENATPEQCND